MIPAKEISRRRVTVAQALQETTLPLGVIAALRQAAAAGITLVDAVTMLTDTGYALILQPVEGEGEATPLAGMITDDMDMMLEKGRSFTDENARIQRSKRTRLAKEPHPFKAARWKTRDGRVRCMTCGSSNQADVCSGVSKAALSVGDYATWNSSGGPATGRVERIVSTGTIKVPDSSFEIAASEGDPAVLLTVYRRFAGSWRETKTQVGHKASALTKVPPLDIAKGTLVKATKREAGEDFPAEAFAYVPDPEKPSTWKLRLWDSLADKVTARQVGMAVAALGKGYRGNKVQIPAADLPGVKGRVLAAWRKVHPPEENPPAALKAADSFTPPEGVQEAARRALQWIEEGRAGSGFTDVGRKRASDLARGAAVSLETIGRMVNYFSRHESDSQATGFSAGEDGYPSPGRVAWNAWGGDAGRDWANSVYDRMNKNAHGYGDGYGDMPEGMGGESMLDPADFLREPYDPEDALDAVQQALYETLEQIVEAAGPFDPGTGARGAHYMPPEDNPFSAEGICCANCIFYEGGGGCEILTEQVDHMGACKFWIIPETLLSMEPMEPSMAKGATVLKQEDRRFTMGPMYIPDMIDAHGEWTDAPELQDAVWDYVKSGDRRIRLQHNRDVVAGEWVECMAWPYPVTVPMTDEMGKSSQVTLPANTVFLGVQWEPWAWELVKAGKLRGYSIGGTSDRVLVDFPEGA